MLFIFTAGVMNNTTPGAPFCMFPLDLEFKSWTDLFPSHFKDITITSFELNEEFQFFWTKFNLPESVSTR